MVDFSQKKIKRMKIEAIKFLRVKLGDSLSEAESFAVKISKNKQM